MGVKSGGFSLVEAIIALTIGAMLVALVSTLFLVQNEFYGTMLLRGTVQDAARSVTSAVAEEARSVVPGGVIVADSLRVGLRVPITMAVVCDPGHRLNVHLVGGLGAVDGAEVAGYGLRASDGTWTFHEEDWDGIYSGGGKPSEECASLGADTSGVAAEYVRFKQVDAAVGATLAVGDPIMIYRATEFTIAASGLDPGTLALYRGPWGGTLTEFASGLAAGTHFEYRRGDTTHYASVAAANLSEIDGLRIVAASSAPSPTGGAPDVTFSLTFDQLLRNAR